MPVAVEQNYRTIHISDPIKNQTQNFMNNNITTAKYSPLTFVPKFLFEQFSKYANMFFLFIAIIQQIPDLSPINRFGVIVTLSIVLCVSASKEINEDRKRHSQDDIVNNRNVLVLAGESFVQKKWKEVVVGDICRVENSEYFPADLILLSSSEPNALCYIETSNLDGETNLKIRQGLTETANILSSKEASYLEGTIKSELPNNSLYTFEATLRLREKELPLNPDQLLLRGAMLRNTRWIYGIAVFTGHETKLLKNSTKTPIKKSNVDNMVNKHIIYMFFILVSMALICASGALRRQLNNSFEQQILRLKPEKAWINFFANILTYIILFNNFIPMSLIVTLEIVKYMLGTMINSDQDMYHEETDTPATTRTSSLVEELGQIDYVFSDKTGTLTCNQMEFKMLTIAGVAYAQVGWYDFVRLKEHEESGPASTIVKEFLQLLAVCHTVIPEENEDNPDIITYQASSPDEAALVKGAKLLGYEFRVRKPKSVSYRRKNVDHEWQVLNINEFNSTRKRMSALVQSPDGKIKLYVKGADTVILERLAKDNNPFVDATCELLEEYANEGLRTLCIAYRDISMQEYEEWARIYDKAATTINNRTEELMKAAELIERDLILLGATAIEDRLQDGVPETIHTMAEAGVRVWVLTGDRQETAINIGYSCRLITEELSIIICNEATHFETKEFLEGKLDALREISPTLTAPINAAEPSNNSWNFFSSKSKLRKTVNGQSEPLVLVIDGKSLEFALEEDIKLTFLELATMCKSVICCRVSPLQKAQVVKLVRNSVEGAVTLAIGDGANDVGMIQSAHVGVGISGLEGLQAARSADFAIAQFRFLKKLLLVHGNWAYSRISKVILFSFYKNIVLYLIQLWFSFENGFSGQTLFETWTASAYNIAFAFFQPMAIGIFDQYVNARMLEKYPKLYSLGHQNYFYNDATFWFWFANCVFQSLVLFCGFSWALGEGTIMSNGMVMDNWGFGEMVYTADLVTITIKASLTATSWVSLTVCAIVGSIGLWFVLYPIYASIGPLINIGPELRNVLSPMFTSLTFWMGILLLPIVCNIRDIAWKFQKRISIPADYHVIQEMHQLNIPDLSGRAAAFKQKLTKARIAHRQKRMRGFAFSQNEQGQADLIRQYDTTKHKPKG